MTFHDPHDPKRPLKYSEYERSRLSDDRFSGWGIPALIALVVFAGGLLLFGTAEKNLTTASYERGTITTPAPQTPPPVPLTTPQ